mgnify:CR=1 FL=1
MTSEIQMNSSSLQSLLIILVIICAISYAYLEFRKINARLDVLENKESRTEQMFLELKESLQKDNFKSSFKSSYVEESDKNMDANVNDVNDNDVNDNDVNDNDVNDNDEIIMDSVSVSGDNNQEKVEQESQEVYEQPTVMSFSFLSTMNHIETPSNENNIEDITGEDENKEETVITDDNSVVEDSETKIIKTDKYDNCTVKELKDILTEKNLPTSGNKTKLIQRIIESTQ